jgi:hypothetical protein
MEHPRDGQRLQDPTAQSHDLQRTAYTKGGIRDAATRRDRLVRAATAPGVMVLEGDNDDVYVEASNCNAARESRDDDGISGHQFSS